MVCDTLGKASISMIATQQKHILSLKMILSLQKPASV